MWLPNDEMYRLYSCKTLSGNVPSWNEALEGISKYDPAYMPYMIMYQEQYFVEKDEYYKDYSCVFYSDNRPVGVWPLCVYKRNGRYFIGTNGTTCMFPLIADHLIGTKSHRKMADCYVRFLARLCEEYKISDFEMHFNYLLYKPDIVYEKLIRSNAIIQYSRHDLYVDLRQGADYVWKGLRKRARTQINSARKDLTCEIIDNSCCALEDVVEQFRRLHISVAGRETRSEKTWKIQELTVRNSGSFIVLLKDSSEELIGALLVTSTPNVAQASVAAYKRELFDKYALGHVCEMTAIERLCMQGKQWYHIGAMPLPQDIPTPTDKEISIGVYKKGFCTDWTVLIKVIVTQDVLRGAIDKC